MWWLLGLFKGRSISTYIIIGLSIVLSTGGLYVKQLRNANNSLENQSAILESIVQDNNRQIEQLNADRQELDEIIAGNLAAREENKTKLNQYQNKLRELRNESKDECLGKPIDPAILDRLQHKDSKEH